MDEKNEERKTRDRKSKFDIGDINLRDWKDKN